nr:NAD-dependent deacylase [Alkalihalobacterium alkalinitrilicum]
MFELFYALTKSKHTVVLTGAGMSVESGIPDFRSPSGWWKNIDPLTVATVEALEENYDLFYEFYSVRINTLKGCEPHEGYRILAKWERSDLIHEVATQNVDGFHFKALSNHVDELHGSILTYRCHQCENEASRDQFLNKESCNFCNGKLRPNVVLFGEALLEKAWNNALNHIQQADLVIVIGTSLQVYPVSQLPKMTNGKTVYINKEVSEFQSLFDVKIEGSARDTLIAVDQLIRS